MQNEYNCFFFIADWHSLTTHPHPDNIRNSVKTILAEYLACGIDPEKATIYLQSDVREIPELYLYLNMNAGIGELMRTTSFKDKARQQLHIDRVNTTLNSLIASVPQGQYIELSVARRTMETLRDYVSQIETGMTMGRPVVVCQAILEEVRSVAALIQEMLNNYISREIGLVSRAGVALP